MRHGTVWPLRPAEAATPGWGEACRGAAWPSINILVDKLKRIKSIHYYFVTNVINNSIKCSLMWATAVTIVRIDVVDSLPHLLHTWLTRDEGKNNDCFKIAKRGG